jgi:tetratricopeptide (TPR) repeat protein
MFQLKKLAAKNLEAALGKAETYRDLNQPEEAESICHDVLDADPKNQHALVVLGLAITDQFHGQWVGKFERAMETFAKLESEYERTYYAGIAWERSAKGYLERNEGHGAMTALEHALELYERAEAMAPEGSPDPILRFNRCVRLMVSHALLRDAASSSRISMVPPLGD